MPNNAGNSNNYHLKKQAVFDALHECCDVNQNNQVSLISVLLYISKEIDARFINSEPLIHELKQKLKDQDQNGWLSFEEVCTIFGAWMDVVSKHDLHYNPNNDMSNETVVTSDLIQYPPELCHISPALPSVRKTILNGLLNENVEEFFTKCEKCGREENCCEWRNNELCRQEKIAKCYEQRVTELQNLLRQSEDCNSLMLLENESLHQNCAVLQSKEQRWIEKEEELKEHELQLTSANTLLNEQIAAAHKEIQLLKQHLGRLKNENEKLSIQNQTLEEKVTERTKIEKLLCEAKTQQSNMQLELQTKDLALTDIELKLESLQQLNEVNINYH